MKRPTRIEEQHDPMRDLDIELESQDDEIIELEDIIEMPARPIDEDEDLDLDVEILDVDSYLESEPEKPAKKAAQPFMKGQAQEGPCLNRKTCSTSLGMRRLVLSGIKDDDALRAAAGDADALDRTANHLATIGDQHDPVGFFDRHGGHELAVALVHGHRDDAFAAAPESCSNGAAGALAVTVSRGVQDN